METNELVKALRCSAQIPSNEEQCAGCPYFVLETPSEDDVKELGLEPEWKWKSCNVDQMALDAADLIEKQAVEIRELRNSLAVFGQANAALRDKVPERIPVSKRLPEPEKMVLLTVSGKVRISPLLMLMSLENSTQTRVGSLKCGRNGKTPRSPTGCRCPSCRRRNEHDGIHQSAKAAAKADGKRLPCKRT